MGDRLCPIGAERRLWTSAGLGLLGTHRSSGGRLWFIEGGGGSTHTRVVDIVGLGGLVFRVDPIDNTAGFCLHGSAEGLTQQGSGTGPGGAPRMGGRSSIATDGAFQAARGIGRIELAWNPSNRESDVGTNRKSEGGSTHT